MVAVKTGFNPPPVPGMPAPMQPMMPMGGAPARNPFAPMPPMPLAGMPPPRWRNSLCLRCNSKARMRRGAGVLVIH